jgi:hypothetical protein
MARPKGSRNRMWAAAMAALAERQRRLRRDLARLRWWERNRPPGY